MRKHEWVVYGAYDGDKLMYIGKTGNLAEREQFHRWNAEWACKCRFRWRQVQRDAGVPPLAEAAEEGLRGAVDV